MTATSKAKSRPASSKLAVKSAPPPKRARKAASASPSSSAGSDDDMDKAAMLAALNAHSRAMFGFDGPDEAESSTQARARASRSVSGSQAGSDDQDGDGGFDSDDGWGEGDDMVTDSEDELEAAVETKVVKPAKVLEVVFAPTQTSSSVMLSKSERRAFLVSIPVRTCEHQLKLLE